MKAKAGFRIWTGVGLLALAAPAVLAAGDGYESDNIRASAKLIVNGQTQNHSLHRAGDTDWTRFQVKAVGARGVTIATAGAAGDTQLWLYRADGTLIAYDDNSGAGNFSRIRVAYLASGIYFVRVRENGNDGIIPAYTLKAGWNAGDAWECDDTATKAKSIANGATQRHSIHAATDADWMKFTVGEDGARNVRVATSGAQGDTQLWLYGPNNPAIPAAYDDDSGNGYFSKVSLASLRPGTYWIKITSLQACGNTGVIPTYTLKTIWTIP